MQNWTAPIRQVIVYFICKHKSWIPPLGWYFHKQKVRKLKTKALEKMLMFGAMGDMTSSFPLEVSLFLSTRLCFPAWLLNWERVLGTGAQMAGRKGTSFHFMRFPQLITTCLKIYCCTNQNYQCLSLSILNSQCCVLSFCLYYDKIKLCLV